MLGPIRLSLLHLGEEEADRVGALLTDRLVDRRQGRVDVGGEVDVVEADDAQVVGDAQAQLARRAHGADGHRVAHGQDRGRAEAHGPGALEGGRAAVDRGAAGDDAVVRELDAGGIEAPPVAAQPALGDALADGLGASAGRLRALDRDHEQVAVAELEDVLRGGARAGLVVDDDRAVLGQVVGVDEDHRQAGAAGSGPTSGWSADRPIATTPSTVERPTARASEPCSGEMKCSS